MNLKRLKILLLLLWVGQIFYAQTPQAFSYQAVLRNTQSELLVTTTVGIKVSILKDGTDGTVVYTETHQPITNENGLVTLQIGNGTTSNDFSSIDWGDGIYFVKTEIDIEGGSDYTISSVSQLLSVPYALYAENTGNASGLNELKAEVALMKHTMSAGGYAEDIDGNQYNSVKIGNQIWMAENLKVTHYPDGTEIPLVEETSAWISLGDNNTSDGYCWYNNDIGNKDKYGALYTWAAAMGDNAVGSDLIPSGVQGVCPDGWHLPSHSEWLLLKEYLTSIGYEGIEGEVMKSDIDWNGTNLVGFNAVPSGIRHPNDGTFERGESQAFWWSSKETSSYGAKGRKILTSWTDFFGSDDIKSWGFSVRCIKDQ